MLQHVILCGPGTSCTYWMARTDLPCRKYRTAMNGYVKTSVIINILVASLMTVHSSSDPRRYKAVTWNCSCYTFNGSKALSWKDSRQECKRTAGRDLVSMETKEEWTFILEQIQGLSSVAPPHQATEWHIGLHETSDRWTWVSGASLITNPECKGTKGCWPWQQGEPNGDGNVTLMAKNYPTNTEGLFNDVSRTSQKRGFICELKTDNCRGVEAGCPQIVQTTPRTSVSETDPAVNSESTKASTSTPRNTATTANIKTARATAKTTSSETPSPRYQKTQSSKVKSEIPTSVNIDGFDKVKSDYTTKTSAHVTWINEPDQSGDSDGSPISMVIVGLATGLALLIIVSVILVTIVLCRRRRAKKNPHRQLQEMHNRGFSLSTSHAFTPDGEQVPAQRMDGNTGISNKTELIYADLIISRKNRKNQVVRPEPYVPTHYAIIRSTQGSAAAQRGEQSAENQDAEDVAYAAIV